MAGQVFFRVNGACAKRATHEPRVAAELRAYMASLSITKRMPVDEYGNKYSDKAKN